MFKVMNTVAPSTKPKPKPKPKKLSEKQLFFKGD